MTSSCSACILASLPNAWQNVYMKRLPRWIVIYSDWHTCIKPGWHINASVYLFIGWGRNLSPVQHQAITHTNSYSCSIRPQGTKLSEIEVKIFRFSFNKMHLTMFEYFSPKWRSFCLDLNVSPDLRISLGWCMGVGCPVSELLRILVLLYFWVFVPGRWSQIMCHLDSEH